MATPDKQKIYREVDIQQAAIALVNGERNRWSDAVCFVTDRVAFQMRNLVRSLRKNYWGVFDVPGDPLTGRNKIWVPLTRTLVEGVVKNIDLDTKDVNFRARNDKGYSITRLIRNLVKRYLDNNYFGETLDEMERQLAIDGTVVWKIFEGTDKEGKPTVVRRTVDLLNVYIDPTEDNIQNAFRFTERSLMLPSEIEMMTGWMNRDDLTGASNLSRIDGQYQVTSGGTTAKYRDVWEMWGKIPQSFLKGKYDIDGNDDLIDGHIVVSGLEAGDPKCHVVEGNLKNWKPYEEVRYAKVPNRWYGLGIAERVLMLQIWINTIVNIRINRSYVSQLGLFKIRKGSGITPQMLSRLGANGAIVVNDPSDIEQFQVDEASQASYTDESKIIDWAQRDTNAFDISVGESTPSSKPATTSVIENNSAKSGFKMVKDSISSFVERCMDRHMLPILSRTVTVSDMIEVSNEDDIAGLADDLVAFDAQKELASMFERGIVPTAQALQKAIDSHKEQIMKKPNMFITLTKKLIHDHVYTKVFMTNEEMDPSVMVQNIMQMLQYVPQEAHIPLIRESMDLMGLDFDMPKPQPPTPPTPDIKQSINFKDLPADGQAQMAAEAGIKLGQSLGQSLGQPQSPQQQPQGTPPGTQGSPQGIMGGLQTNQTPIITRANTLNQ